MGMEESCLVKRDRKCIWHPFTQMKTAPLPIPIERGEGAWLFDMNGKGYLDAFSSWWVNLHGHSHPHIIDRMMKQADKLEHVVFTDFTHQPAVELAEKLLGLLPPVYSKVFYSDNGSTAVEAALKMAIQFGFNRHFFDKPRVIVSFKGGYHGDTFGAMASAGKGVFNQPFWPYLFSVLQIDPPFPGFEEESLQQLKSIISSHDVAAFIFEPLVQGVGGMRMHSLEGLDRMLDLCHRNEIITIADEVMTGFGRTGTDFVSFRLKHSPSIICAAKGMTGGMLPLAATICKQEVYEAFLSDDKQKAFLHGHSYTANPLACAAALASIELLETEECRMQRSMIEREHLAFCRRWKRSSALSRMETIGTILAVEYHSHSSAAYFQGLADRMKKFFLERGILIRPIGNVLYVMPPYCIKKSELNKIYDSITATLEVADD